jgi:predicted RNA-binding Zn ribbon-like protein
LGEPAALDLANTVAFRGGARETDLIPTPDECSRWLRARDAALGKAGEQAISVTSAELDRLHGLRGVLHAVLEARVRGTDPAASELSELNESARATAPTLDWPHGERPYLAAAGPAQAVLAEAVASAVVLLSAPDGTIRACAHPDCTLFFAATNPRRRWCSSATCGNRARVMRHHRRGQPAL